MDNESAVKRFKNILKDDPDVSPAIAALMVLLEFLSKDSSETIQGLDNNIKSVVKALNGVDCSFISVDSACELFLRFITLTSLDHTDFAECKQVLSKRGSIFLKRVSEARSKITKKGLKYMIDGMKILVHSHSRVVYHLLLEAFKGNKSFHVYVAESAPDFSGKLMYDKLVKAEIPCTLILNASVGYFMEKIDCVFLGAESVCESGGIINKIGSYAIAMCAKTMNKPIYVLAESFKFSRLFPLNNRDLPNVLKHLPFHTDDSKEHPLVDYTPPSYITLFISDLGILTTTAVSDEIINLYM